MRPIYNFLVRGHHCSATEKYYCERCSSRSKRSASGSGGTNKNEVNNEKQIRNESVPSVIESVEKGGRATTFEMC